MKTEIFINFLKPKTDFYFNKKIFIGKRRFDLPVKKIKCHFFQNQKIWWWDKFSRHCLAWLSVCHLC